MAYTERLSDQERLQTYTDLVHGGVSGYPGGEAAVILELLSSRHVDRRGTSRPANPFAWLPSLYRTILT